MQVNKVQVKYSWEVKELDEGPGWVRTSFGLESSYLNMARPLIVVKGTKMGLGS